MANPTIKPVAVGDTAGAALVNNMFGILDRNITEVNVLSSNVETTVYSFSVAAASLSSTRALQIELGGDILYSVSAGSQTGTLRVKYGTSTVWSYVIGSDFGTGNPFNWALDVKVQANGSTTAQVASGFMAWSFATVGQGNGIYAACGTGSADSASAQTLAVTFQWGTASASLGFRKRRGILTLL